MYLKRTPGVTLRSARFDNNVMMYMCIDHQSASGFFADNTQRKLIQILAEMNVQIPQMATKRICDTLDRLKQDIVKLILLRVDETMGSHVQKYSAQKEIMMPSPVPMMYQTVDTKVWTE